MTRYGDIAQLIKWLASPQGSTELHGPLYFPCAVALRFTSRSPGERLFCHRHRQKLASTHLTPAPRRQDHTTFAVRVMHVRLAHSTSTASHRTFVTIATRPSSAVDARIQITDLPDEASAIFLCEGLDRLLVICPSGSLEPRRFHSSNRCYKDGHGTSRYQADRVCCRNVHHPRLCPAIP